MNIPDHPSIFPIMSHPLGYQTEDDLVEVI